MTKKSTLILFLILLITTLLVGFLLFLDKDYFNNKEIKTPSITISKNGKQLASFEVELADTPEKQSRGLMGRSDMDQNKGMFFIFTKEQPLSFWMKNTLIPLDIIFISSDHQIVSISSNAKPCISETCALYYSTKPAQYVLEINGGLSQKLNIYEGMEVQFINSD